MDDLMEQIGYRLKKIRMELGLSMSQVTSDMKKLYDIDLDKASISRWENGKNIPSLIIAYYICDYYDVSLDFLINMNSDITEKITFTIAECNKFHKNGELHENIRSVRDAVRLYKTLPNRNNDDSHSISIRIMEKGKIIDEIDIIVNNVIDLTILKQLPYLKDNKQFMTAIGKLLKYFPDYSIIGEEYL